MPIHEADLLIEAYPERRSGGQYVGICDPGVKITHLPTGIGIIWRKERSQTKNKNRAIEYLEYILELEGCLPAEESLSTTQQPESNKSPGG